MKAARSAAIEYGSSEEVMKCVDYLYRYEDFMVRWSYWALLFRLLRVKAVEDMRWAHTRSELYYVHLMRFIIDEVQRILLTYMNLCELYVSLLF